MRRPPSEFKSIYFDSSAEANASLALLNGSLFYWFITLLSDCRHLNKREVERFPLAVLLLKPPQAALVSAAVSALMLDLQSRSETRVMKFRHDQLTVQCILPKKSWATIQRIDQLIGEAIGLTPAEADYVENYDIKYRLGQGSSDD
jgi:hypothetical protein